MGYTTDFIGQFEFNKPLSLEDKNFLTKLAQTRRMARNIEGYGVEGEFYVDGEGFNGYTDPRADTIINQNMPPKTQPGLWCQWIPSEDGKFLQWDYGEKFYDYAEWLQYIINWIKPRGYKLNGSVRWQGEESGDVGLLVVTDNELEVRKGFIQFENSGTRVFFVTDGPIIDDSDVQNEELFETLEEAEDHAKLMNKPRIRVCIVRQAYKEDDGTWNYEDEAGTFETIKTIRG